MRTQLIQRKRVEHVAGLEPAATRTANAQPDVVEVERRVRIRADSTAATGYLDLARPVAVEVHPRRVTAHLEADTVVTVQPVDRGVHGPE